MDIERKKELLAEILDVDADELTPDTKFADLEWDSVAVLSFIVMMDDEFDREISGSAVKKFVTVQDALDVMEK